MTRRLRRPAALALTVLATVAAAWLLAHEGHAPLPSDGLAVDAALGTAALSPEAQAALGVRTGDVVAAAVADDVVAPVTLVSQWDRHAFASPRLGGRVAALHVRPGQTVEAGQILAELQSLELDGLVQEGRAAAEDVRRAADEVAALEAARQAVAEQALTEARARHREALIAAHVARHKLSFFGLTEDDIKEGRTPLLAVRSPLAGVLTHAEVRLGQVAEPGDHLFEVVDVSELWAVAAVLEKDLPRVEVGRPAELRFAAHGNAALTAPITSTGRALDAGTRLGSAWAVLRGGDSARPLLPGMTGSARLSGPTTKAVALPASALAAAGVERYVFVETAPGQYQRQNVVVLRQERERVFVRPGSVFPGDRVAAAGAHELAPYFAPQTLRLSDEAVRAVGLRVEPAARRRVADVVTLLGEIDLPPDRRAVASARLAGTVRAVRVARDQVVKAGDVVAEVETTEVQNLHLEALKAEMQARLAEETAARLQAVGAVGRRREAEATARAARLRRDGARRRLETLGLTADDSAAATLPVRAPIGGAVVRLFRAPGQAVKAEDALFEIHNVAGAAVRMAASERDLAQVRVGQRARVTLPARPDFVADAAIRRSARSFDAERTLALWAEFTEPLKDPLPAGTLARVTVVVGDGPEVLALPRAAVVGDGASDVVFVRLADGRFERRRVTVGRGDDRFVEVTSGLTEGEPVAVRGAADLLTAHAAVR